MGEFAALLTSACWAFSAVLFTLAGRKVGAAQVNRLRLLFGLVFFLLIHLLATGTLIPLNASWQTWMWLGLSGVVGLALGDLALFQSYLYVGPRMGALIMAVVPVFSTIFAWFFLGEWLDWVKIAGIVLAVAGIALVVLERGSKPEQGAHDRRQYLQGIFYGFLAAAGQTAGLLLTKRGLADGFPALSGVLIRVLVACLVLWAVALTTRQAHATFSALRERRTLNLLLAGSLIGPFAGVWLSTIAIQLTAVGIASTLTSLAPILLLPISAWLFHERISIRAIAGTFLTIVGVVILFLL